LLLIYLIYYKMSIKSIEWNIVLYHVSLLSRWSTEAVAECGCSGTRGQSDPMSVAPPASQLPVRQRWQDRHSLGPACCIENFSSSDYVLIIIVILYYWHVHMNTRSSVSRMASIFMQLSVVLAIVDMLGLFVSEGWRLLVSC